MPPPRTSPHTVLRRALSPQAASPIAGELGYAEQKDFEEDDARKDNKEEAFAEDATAAVVAALPRGAPRAAAGSSSR